jgi:Ca2+-binding RTX toxin-like protein
MTTITINGSQNSDNLTPAEDADTIAIIYLLQGRDTLYGGIGRDWASGDQGRDALFGGAGFDNLTGDAGNDLLDGGTDGDALFGGAGNDTLYGGDGNDGLFGGGGKNDLFGGTGGDWFWITSQKGLARIGDFNPAEDLLVFSSSVFSASDDIQYDPDSGKLTIDEGSHHRTLAVLAKGLDIDSADFLFA